MYAEIVASNIQDALWEGLREYNRAFERDCPEDEYDVESQEMVQDITNEWTPKLFILGQVLGYDHTAMDTVMDLIEDYHHTEAYDSERIDAIRRAEYERLQAWLSSEWRQTPFQDIGLTGIVWNGGPLDDAALLRRANICYQDVQGLYARAIEESHGEEEYPCNGDDLALGPQIQVLARCLYP